MRGQRTIIFGAHGAKHDENDPHTARMTMLEHVSFIARQRGAPHDAPGACATREPARKERPSGPIVPIPPLGPLKVVFGPVPSRRLGRSNARLRGSLDRARCCVRCPVTAGLLIR